MDRLRFQKILLLSNVAERIKPGSSKATVISTEVSVHYRWFLASVTRTLHLCFALAFRVYWVSIVKCINRLHPVLSADFLDLDRFVLL